MPKQKQNNNKQINKWLSQYDNKTFFCVRFIVVCVCDCDCDFSDYTMKFFKLFTVIAATVNRILVLKLNSFISALKLSDGVSANIVNKLIDYKSIVV